MDSNPNRVFELDLKLKRIEEIVEILDAGSVSLEEMINLYEEGMVLSTECRAYLENAEQRIIEISGKYSDTGSGPGE